MWVRALDRLLSEVMVRDRLRVRLPSGEIRTYGPAGGETASLEIETEAALRSLCLNPSLGLGEGYMAGTLTFNERGLEDTIVLLLRNREAGRMPGWLRASHTLRYHARRIIQHNTPFRSRANVAHHYDISDDLYRLFLDADMQYSCAYFTDPDMTLEAAQEAKKAHIGRKLRIEPGCHVLDIGCGWGGMALTLARDFDARVTGITLSENQLATARRRAQEAGLADRVTFQLQDYRHTKGKFDRIVSVGMLEHVGVPNYTTYFSRVSDLLAPDGVALIHTIGRSAPPVPHDPWINKYIFPGGYVPSLSELAGPLEQADLWQSDIEVWRLHYARTLRHWRTRFETHRDRVLEMYDERFVRMFWYYFTVCIIAFEHQRQAVYQFQLAHDRQAVPLTRGYLYGGNAQSQG
ncbi:MAG: cyclopropane-fatty-acyl-phospholipid synthase [Sulfitobacter sp.]|nr:cyclopropane-fatty-acyl-phospholipid synthase [Sulfitobacter sp.]